MSVTKRGNIWVPVGANSRGTRIGGEAPEILMDHWPFFEGEPLPFFGRIIMDGEPTIYLFLSNTGNRSWQPENGANAVLVDGSWEVGDWIELKALDSASAPLYSDKAYAPHTMELSPKWLQGDEEQEGYHFVFQVPSQIDGGSAINIGDAYGDAYVFIADDGATGRLLWQA